MSQTAPAAATTTIDYRTAPAALTTRGRRHPERWLAFAAICVTSIGYLLPLVWMFSTSIKPLDQTMRYPPQWLPDGSIADWSKTAAGNYWRVITHDKMDF